MDVGEAIVGKLSSGQIFFIIVAIVAIAAYYLPKVRRDNKGKLYIYNGKYEDQKRDMKTMIESVNNVNEKLKGLSIEVLKCNIYNETMPVKDRLCSAVRYMKSGYNSETKSYIESHLAAKYPEEYALCWDIIKVPNL